MRTDDAPRAGRREWIGLGVLALPCLLYSMDLTVLNLAIPHLSEALRPTSAELLWIVDIYGFLIAGALIPMGSLGDRIGRRRLLLIGAAAFGVASVAAACSTTAATLIATRAVLGVAGASFAPSTLSLIRSMFLDPRQRTVAIGVWVTSYSVGGVIGPLIGGLVLQSFGWSSVFLIGVPVMLLLLVLGPVLLPEHKDPHAGPLDLVSAGLSLASVLLVIYGLKRLAEHGVGAVPAAAIAIGLVIGVAFVRRQHALDHPMIDLALVRVPVLRRSLITYTLCTFLMFGTSVFLAQYLQLVLGLSPLHAGLATLPSTAGFIVASLVVPVIARRVAAAHVMTAGLAVSAVGFAVLAAVDAHAGLAVVVVGSVLYALGFSPVVILATDLIVGTAPVERAGAASAMSETGSELGGALGIAVLGSIGVAVYRGAMIDGVPRGIPAGAAGEARATLAGAVAVARDVHTQGAELLATARDAFTHAFAVIAGISAAVALVLAITTLAARRATTSGYEKSFPGVE